MESNENRMLPPPLRGDEQAYIEIKPFDTGLMVTPAATLVGDAQGTCMGTSWRFLLRHSKTNTNFWFDMGISQVYKPQTED